MNDTSTTATLSGSIKILFPLGQCLMTSGINELVEQHQLPVAEYLMRHQTGDWGEVVPEDAAENELALKEGFRILSAYTFTPSPPSTDDSIKIWIITEADRSSTTVLLPSEY